MFAHPADCPGFSLDNELHRWPLPLAAGARSAALGELRGALLPRHHRPQITLQLDREKARDVGLSTLSISNTLRVLVGGLDVAKYNDDPGDGERYDIRLRQLPC